MVSLSLLYSFINAPPSLQRCMCIVTQAAAQQCMNMHPARVMAEKPQSWKAGCILLKCWDWIQLNRVNDEGSLLLSLKLPRPPVFIFFLFPSECEAKSRTQVRLIEGIIRPGTAFKTTWKEPLGVLRNKAWRGEENQIVILWCQLFLILTKEHETTHSLK